MATLRQIEERDAYELVGKTWQTLPAHTKRLWYQDYESWQTGKARFCRQNRLLILCGFPIANTPRPEPGRGSVEINSAELDATTDYITADLRVRVYGTCLLLVRVSLPGPEQDQSDRRVRRYCTHSLLTNIESNNYPLSVYAPAENPLCVITSGSFSRLAFELWTMQGRIVAQAFGTYAAT